MIDSLVLNPAQPRAVPAALSIESQFLALQEECEHPLYGYLLRMLRDPDVAQDCAQDTFVRAHDALRRGQKVSRPWIFRVAHNRAIDEFRRNSRSSHDPDALDAAYVTESTDRSLAVREVMERLDPLDRKVLHLFAVDGFKTHEIGDMLGVTGSAVRQRLYRAREKFRVLYEESR